MTGPVRAGAGAMLAALVLAACGGDDDGGRGGETAAAPPAGGTTEQAPAPSEGGATRVELDEFEFRPARVTVERGERVEAANVGSVGHNFTIIRGGDALAATETFPAGETRALRVDVEPGRYTLVCTVPGHRERGMEGTIRIR